MKSTELIHDMFTRFTKVVNKTGGLEKKFGKEKLIPLTHVWLGFYCNCYQRAS